MEIDRRHLIAGSLCGLVAGCSPRAANAAPAQRWQGYSVRLQQHLTSSRAALDPAMAKAIFSETNAFRRAEGKTAVVDDPELALAAQAHAADMQTRRFFAHDTPDGFGLGERVGLLCRTFMGSFGENIAFIDNARRPPTARQFFEGWRDSPGHRQNMLRSDHTHVGHAALRYGSRVVAVAVFGGLKARLTKPLPLTATGADLNVAVSGASPAMQSYLLSAPTDQEAIQRPYIAAGPGPTLDAGAWRLRPLMPRGGPGAFDVLWGPIFFVGEYRRPT